MVGFKDGIAFTFELKKIVVFVLMLFKKILEMYFLLLLMKLMFVNEKLVEEKVLEKKFLLEEFERLSTRRFRRAASIAIEMEDVLKLKKVLVKKKVKVVELVMELVMELMM